MTTDLVEGFEAYLSRQVREADAEAQRKKQAEEESRNAHIRERVRQQFIKLEETLGKDLLAGMQRDGFELTGMFEPETPRNSYTSTGPTTARAYIVLKEPRTERAIELWCQPSPPNTASDGVTWEIKSPIGPKDNSGAFPGFTSRKLYPAELGKMLALVIAQLRELHLEHAEATAAARAKIEANRREEEERRTAREKSEKRLRKVKERQQIAHDYENEYAGAQAARGMERMRDFVWKWREGGGAVFYEFTIHTGVAYRDDDGDLTFQTKTEYGLDPNVHEGHWPFIRSGKHAPTKLEALSQGQACLIETTTRYAKSIDDLPPAWTERQHGTLVGLQADRYDDDGARTFVRASKQGHDVSLGKVPIEIVRRHFDQQWDRDPDKWRPKIQWAIDMERRFREPHEAAELLYRFSVLPESELMELIPDVPADELEQPHHPKTLMKSWPACLSAYRECFSTYLAAPFVQLDLRAAMLAMAAVHGRAADQLPELDPPDGPNAGDDEELPF